MPEQCSPFLHEANNRSSFYDRPIREDVVILKKKSDTDNVVDNFKWTKYGEKAVKGNPYARTYYKCNYKDCNVRRQCERSIEDPEYVIVSYEGMHEHDWPRVKGDRGPGVFIEGEEGGQGGFVPGVETTTEITSGLNDSRGDGVYREGWS